MKRKEVQNTRPSVVISAVRDDDTIIETIYRPETNDTALVIAHAEKFEIVPEWASGNAAYIPVSAGNNLIKHTVLLLPSAPAEYGDTGELLTAIEAYIRRYVALSDQATKISAAYVLLSWVYDAFNEVPYLRFRGDYGTGKTRALLVIGSLCHKAFFASGASTVSPIFHTLDTFRGTLIFDEADFRFSDEKAELVKILNNGNAKGFPVLRTRMTPQKEFDPRAFSIFGPKIVGMRRSYDDRALESRFLTFEMTPHRPKSVPINLPDAQKEEALELRNKLLMYRLRNRLLVTLDAAFADPGLEARMNQILLPLLSIAPGDELREVILRTAESLQARNVLEQGTSIESQMLSVLDTVLAEDEEKSTPLSDIAAAFTTQYGDEYDRPIANRWIGSIFRRLGIALYKSNGVTVLVPGQHQKIGALCARYGIRSVNGTIQKSEIS